VSYATWKTSRCSGIIATSTAISVVVYAEDVTGHWALSSVDRCSIGRSALIVSPPIGDVARTAHLSRSSCVLPVESAEILFTAKQGALGELPEPACVPSTAQCSHTGLAVIVLSAAQRLRCGTPRTPAARHF
jgi:hypothetical protein